MSLIDKLLELDRAIYHQCEKVAQKAYETAGLGKYDLVRLTEQGGEIFYGGYGLYQCIAGSIEQSPTRGLMGGMIFLTGLMRYNCHQHEIKFAEEREKYQLRRTGAAKAPQYHGNSSRPFYFISAAATAVAATYLMLEGVSKSVYPHLQGNIENFSRALALGFYAGASSVSLWGLASYFKDLPMQPPKVRKKMWKALGDILKEKMTTKGTVPVKVPVEHSAVLEE